MQNPRSVPASASLQTYATSVYPPGNLHPPGDLERWLRNRLRSTALMAAALFVLPMAVPIFHWISEPITTTTSALNSDAINFRVTQADSGVIAVAPEGWRKTASGWQHVSSWPNSAVRLADSARRTSLARFIVAERASEPVWIARIMKLLRKSPPAFIAGAQLLAVGALFFVKRRT